MGHHMRSMLVVFAGLASFLLPKAFGAHASAPPLMIGSQVTYQSVHALRLEGELQWLPTETFGLRLLGGPRFFAGQSPISGTLMLGPNITFDVLAYVPSFFVLYGLDWRPSVGGRLRLGAELAKYLSLHTLITFSAGAEWVAPNSFSGTVSIGLGHRL